MITTRILDGKGVDIKSQQGLQQAFSEEKGFATKIVSASEMKQWAKATQGDHTLMIVPGGKTFDINLDLIQQTKDKDLTWLSDYVKAGGHYLGICAGANLAATRSQYACVRYAYMSPARSIIHKLKGINLLPVNAIGPVRGMGSVFSNAESVEHPKLTDAKKTRVVDANQQSCSGYYLYGPSFEVLDKSKVQVIATYQQSGGEPAIIKGNVGKGQVVLSGIHAEYEPLDVGSEEIEDEQASRNHLMDLIMKELNPVLSGE